jgi:hypothetical protein
VGDMDDGKVKSCGGRQRGRQSWRRRFWARDVDSFDEHVPIGTTELRKATERMGMSWSDRSTMATCRPEAERTGWHHRLSTPQAVAACWLSSASRRTQESYATRGIS